MHQDRSGASWDAEFAAGKYDYLHKPAEKARLVEIAAMIADSIVLGGPAELVDIGCGEGLLLPFLKADGLLRYVGVDISSVALSRLPATPIPAVGVNSDLSGWHGQPPSVGRRILVASEMLYYLPAGVRDLAGKAREMPEIEEVIVSCVSAHADKPNWAAASSKLWRELSDTGWREADRRKVQDGETGICWDIVRYLT